MKSDRLGQVRLKSMSESKYNRDQAELCLQTIKSVCNKNIIVSVHFQSFLATLVILSPINHDFKARVSVLIKEPLLKGLLQNQNRLGAI